MADAVCTICQIPSHKIHINQPVVKYTYSGSQTALDHTQFFYPTSNALYKNIECIQKASSILEHHGISHHITMTLPPQYSENHITCTGRIPHDEVMDSYQKSTLIFPSYIDTFGYPLAEARLAGTIVLASDTAFSREVLDGYENAYFFDPFQPNELANLMVSVIDGTIQKKIPQNLPHDEPPGWKQVIQWIIEAG